MRLIVTEKNNSAKKIADILSGGEAKADATYKVPFYTWSDADGEQMTIGLKGHVDGRRLPGRLLELAGDRPPRPDRRRARSRSRPTRTWSRRSARWPRTPTEVVIATDYDREGELIGLEALRAGPRGRTPTRRQEPRRRPARRPPADQARPLLGAHQGGDRARLRRARRALLRPRLRRRRPPGHRPDLGRDADPRGLAGHPPLRLQLPLRRPRAEPDPGADRRARARAPRPRRRSPTGRSSPASSTPTAPSRPTTRPTSSGRRPRPRRRSPGPRAPASSRRCSSRRNSRKPPTPFNTTAFTTDASSRLGITPDARDAARRGPLHGRLHLLSAHRQHRLSRARSTPASWSPRWCASRSSSAAALLLDGDLTPTRGQEGDHRPPADLPHPGRLPGRARGPEAARLRAGRPPLPGHLRAADGHRVDPRRHRGGLGDATSSAARWSSTPATPPSTPTPAPRDEEIPKLERGPGARRSTAIPGWSTRRPSRRRGSARASWSR